MLKAFFSALFGSIGTFVLGLIGMARTGEAAEIEVKHEKNNVVRPDSKLLDELPGVYRGRTSSED